MAKAKKKPFKVILDAPALRGRLGDLTGDELKVWMHLWLRTNKGSHGIPQQRDYEPGTPHLLGRNQKAKKGLREKGWLSSNGQRVRQDGTFSTVLESVHQPWVGNDTNRGSESDPAVGRKSAHGTVGRNTDDGKPTQQKEHSVNLEVPPAANSENPEGEKASKQVSKEEAPLADARCASASAKEREKPDEYKPATSNEETDQIYAMWTTATGTCLTYDVDGSRDDVRDAQGLIDSYGLAQVLAVLHNTLNERPKSAGMEWTDFNVFARNYELNQRKWKAWERKTKAKRLTTAPRPGSHAALNPELHTGLDGEGKSLTANVTKI